MERRPKWETWAYWGLGVLVLVSVLAMLSGCGFLSPDQVDSATAALNAALARGDITQAQHAAAVEALHAEAGPDWATIIALGANVLLSIFGIPAIVRWQRGPATQAQLSAAGVTTEQVIAAAKATSSHPTR